MAYYLVAISQPGEKGGATSIVTLLGKDRSLYLQTLSLARCLSICRRTLQCMRFFILGPWLSNECIFDLFTTATLSRHYQHHYLTQVITIATKSAKQCDRYNPPPSTDASPHSCEIGKNAAHTTVLILSHPGSGWFVLGPVEAGRIFNTLTYNKQPPRNSPIPVRHAKQPAQTPAASLFQERLHVFHGHPMNGESPLNQVRWLI